LCYVHDKNGRFSRTDHFAYAAANAAIENLRAHTCYTIVAFNFQQANGAVRRALIWIAGGRFAGIALVSALFNRTLAHAQVANLQIIGVIANRDRVPAVNLLIAKQAIVIRPSSLTLEALPMNGQAAVFAHNDCYTHVCFVRVVEVMGERTGWAGEYTLQSVAGKVAGLGAGVQIRHTHPKTFV